MAFIILRDIAKNINDSIFYSIMADEVADCSNKEKFIFCFRWVNKGFNTHEDFIGIYNVDNIKADTLVTVIKRRFDLVKHPMVNAHGQCYDGAKNICGTKNGTSNNFFQKIQGHFSHIVLGML